MSAGETPLARSVAIVPIAASEKRSARCLTSAVSFSSLSLRIASCGGERRERREQVRGRVREEGGGEGGVGHGERG